MRDEAQQQTAIPKIWTVAQRWLNLERYATPIERERALFVYAFSLIALGAYAIYALFIPGWFIDPSNPELGSTTLVQALATRPTAWAFLLVPLGLGLTALLITRFGALAVAAWLPPLMLYLFTTLPAAIDTTPQGVASQGVASATSSVTFVGVMLLAALLNGQNGLLLAVSVVILTLFAVPGELTDLSDLLTLSLQHIAIAFAIFLFLRFANRSLEQGASSATSERIKLADINTQITRRASQRSSLVEAMNAALDLILENYPQFYHAQLFLVDQDGVQARLIASTGAVGQQLLAQDHALAVGSLSVIGQTTLKGKPTVTQANAPNSIHRVNVLLPETLLEAAFPLRIGNHVIGALDIQSKTLRNLSEDDVATFQSLTDSLSLVIDNIRQFENAQQQVREKQQLAEQARRSLEEVERLNKRLVGRAWSEFLQESYDTIGYSLDFEQNTSEQDADWSQPMVAAAQSNASVLRGNVVAVPLRVRGQVIGAMEFELDDDMQIAQEDVELLLDVGERFGLAAENIRLVEESQRAAQRETLINEISSRFQAMNNVEATLTEAARSLYETLKANKIVIQMGTPPKDPSTQSTQRQGDGYSANNGRNS